jgi:HK97 gp10 family phage protein
MAKMTVTIPTDLIDKLEKLGQASEEISKKMLVAGAAILRDKVDKNLKRNLYSGRGYGKKYPTGALERSLTTDKPKRTKSGAMSIRLYFKGKDSKGVANGQKAMSMEYGTSKQQAKPFIRPAVASSENEVNDEMQKVFDQEVSRP